MKKIALSIWTWAKTPNTATGVLLFACGLAGLLTGYIPSDLASGLIGGSLPYLIRNQTIVKVLQASLIPAIAVISRRPFSGPDRR
ncbi:hypothetical protein [Aristophania vespae]|uniref:hypothetical protein n=1 Tax=Aristophania vespae TaxID=2697033 RepID=UPI002351B5CC|nr:hypothetical protein [Aristophania vespae]UMM63150.1 hypothetical protein DM15PD_01050 [Aristophania vespae]